jgi:endonuclease-3
MALFPRDRWIFLSTALVLHGRYVCLARAPRCGECPLRDWCPSVDQENVPPHPRRGRGRG